MAQNITLLGASYSDVPAVELPKTGGGIATFADPSGTTATASDVVQGKLFLNSSGILTTGTASGGGGASNLVQGTFTGTTSGEILEINVPYTGNGYPIAAMIFPKEGGYNSSGTFYNAIQRYAMHTWVMVKDYPLSEPSYTGSASNNKAVILTRYKSSTTSSTTYESNSTSSSVVIYATSSPSSSSSGGNVCKFSSSTKMKVLIASTSYGFMAGIEYVYCIVYST